MSVIDFTNKTILVTGAAGFIGYDNYDFNTQHFDTWTVENVIELVMKYNSGVIVMIVSTISVIYKEFKK